MKKIDFPRQFVARWETSESLTQAAVKVGKLLEVRVEPAVVEDWADQLRAEGIHLKYMVKPEMPPFTGDLRVEKNRHDTHSWRAVDERLRLEMAAYLRGTRPDDVSVLGDQRLQDLFFD